MILGTPRIWYIFIAILIVAGLALVATSIGGMLGNIVGILMLVGGMLVFAAAPMRYGRDAKEKEKEATAAAAPATPVMAPLPPRQRATIEARDADDV